MGIMVGIIVQAGRHQIDVGAVLLDAAAAHAQDRHIGAEHDVLGTNPLDQLGDGVFAAVGREVIHGLRLCRQVIKGVRHVSGGVGAADMGHDQANLGEFPADLQNLLDVHLILQAAVSGNMQHDDGAHLIHPLQLPSGEEIVNASWYNWIHIIVPTYVAGTVVAFLLCRSKDSTPIEKHKMSVGQFICCVFMNTAICGVGAIIGAIVNMMCLVPFGAENTNALAEIMTNSDPFWRILTVGICAPIFEELILRKFLIDRIHKYGEGIAILVSGLLFGLFHGNFSQVFFAAGLGFFFAYIYLRTGKIWYTIAFHMIINMTSAAISMPIIESLDWEIMDKIAAMDPMAAETQALTMQVLPGILLLLGLYAVLGIIALVGIVLWIVMCKKFYLKKSAEYVETKKMSTAFGNFGMVAFLLLCLFLFLQFYLGMIMAA